MKNITIIIFAFLFTTLTFAQVENSVVCGNNSGPEINLKPLDKGRNAGGEVMYKFQSGHVVCNAYDVGSTDNKVDITLDKIENLRCVGFWMGSETEEKINLEFEKDDKNITAVFLATRNFNNEKVKSNCQIIKQ